MKKLVFFLEETSAAVFLEEFLPRAFPVINDREMFEPKFISFSGKHDLQHGLLKKLRGWRAPNTAFVVLQDQDREDCRKAKKRLVAICRKPGARRKKATVRIVCRQLENWYLGDLAAVDSVYGMGLQKKYGNKSRFRNVDELDGEKTLSRITGNEYQKVGGSRKMGLAMNTDYLQNNSHSFRVFCKHVGRLVGGK